METKFIITKDRKHFKSDISDHSVIALKNGYKIKDIIITGLIIDKKIMILECYNKNHLNKIKYTDKFILNDVNSYMDNFQSNLLKSRYIKTIYQYGYIKQGD